MKLLQPTNYRHELKYLCSNQSVTVLEARLQTILQTDNHSIDGRKYTVISIYFDDYQDSCLLANYMGVSDRYKYRIRIYNFDTNTINLEKKIKHDNLSYKKKAVLSLQDVQWILINDSASLLRETDDSLITEFCLNMQSRLFSPKAIVQYERVAFVESVSNTRVTLDTNIVASSDFQNFNRKEKLVFPVFGSGLHVLEVKYDDLLPEYVRRAVQMKTLNQNTISKYCLARQTLKKYWSR